MKILFTVTTIIIFAGTIIRFIGLDISPPHLSNDEISIAYDAYSISKTGKDEHGNQFPLSFKSHGTYKAPLLTYLAVPSTLIFGNTTMTSRVPSAILGCLTLVAVVGLVYLLSKNILLSVITGAVLAITPWHIFTSHMALEANVALFFLVTGIAMFYKFLDRFSRGWIILSSLFFSASIYAYHTEWVFTPVMIILLIIVNRKKLVADRKVLFSFIVLFMLFTVPIGIDYIQNLGTSARANTELIHNDPSIQSFFADNNPSVFTKSQVIVSSILKNYSLYFEPKYLFFDGLQLLEENNLFQSGHFLFPMLIPFVVGLFTLPKIYPKHFKFVYLYLISAPIVPSMTLGTLNHVRNLITIIPITIIIGAGLYVIANKVKNPLKIFYLLITIVSFMYFVLVYFYHFPMQKSINFQYGYRQVADYINETYDGHLKIIIDPRFGIRDRYYSGVPHLYISYFTNIDPRKLHDATRDSKEFVFDKYEIRNIDWGKETIEDGYLYIVPIVNPPLPHQKEKLVIEREILYPNGLPVFSIYRSATNHAIDELSQ